MLDCNVGCGEVGHHGVFGDSFNGWDSLKGDFLMEESIAVFATINLGIIGLSHLFQHQGWREFFQRLHAMGRAGAFVNGMLTLLMGSLIVSFHNVWTGFPILLTVIGWAYVAKATVVLLNPDWNLRSMGSVQDASAAKFRFAGIALLLIAVTIGLCVAFKQY